MLPRTIWINASDVAAVIGRNNFKSSKEVVIELCKKYKIENNSNIKISTKNDIAEEILLKTTNIANIITTNITKLNTNELNSSNIATILANIAIEIENNTTLSTEEKAIVTEYSKNKINTTYGTVKEAVTADLIASTNANANTCASTITIDNKYYHYPIYIGKSIQYTIVGRIDRIETLIDETGAEQKILIEIKNRTKKLFKTLFERENIQVQTYLQLTKLTSAKLVEQYNDEINTICIEKDDHYWDNIVLPALIEFCQNFDELIKYSNLNSQKK